MIPSPTEPRTGYYEISSLGKKPMEEKSFMQKWKVGIQSITALQMSKINLFGSSFIIIGILIGIYSGYVTKTWWLFFVLIGSFVLASITIIAQLQKYIALDRIDKLMKSSEGGTENVIE